MSELVKIADANFPGDLLDWWAANADTNDIHRHRDFYKPAIGGREEPRFTVEQARYRFARAMMAARAEK